MNWSKVESSMSDNETENTIFFTHLKSCCLELLDLLQNPKNQSPALSQLLSLLRSSSSFSIQPLFDYALFPLLLLLDAAVDSRSVERLDSKEKSGMHFANRTPNKVSDVVAEGVVQCLEELLGKCYLASVDQMSVVLKKLTYGAMLSPTEAAEEFREGLVRCFRAVLSNLIPCSDSSCSCKQTTSQPPLLDLGDSNCLSANILERRNHPKECLIAFLQSESASAAVGHWLSLLLNIAETESSRGLRGSAKIRIEALLTLRLLVAKVGTPDALAFFLPGVVTQLAKVLHVSKSMISGAAGSTEATDHAIRGLAEFLMVVLQDDANVPGLISNEDESSTSFLEELRHLNVKSQDLIQTPLNKSSVDAIALEDLGKKQSPNISGGLGPLHVKRSRDWLEKTTGNVDSLLSKTFPHICVHPSKKVRRGLLSAVYGLLSKCSCILKGSRLILLECLCYLVCDDSKDISMPAQDFLRFLFSSHEKYTVEDDLAELFNRILEKLPKLVFGCEESLALASAQQMLAVIYYSGPQIVVDHLLRSPIKAAKLFDVFALCLSQESVFAGSLRKLVLSTSSSTGYLHSLSELRAANKKTVSEYPVYNAATLEVSRTMVKEIQYSTGHAYEDYELPHMPPWLTYLGSDKLYRALAGILRLVGLSLISDCRNEVPLSKIIEIPLGNLRKLVSEIRAKDYNRESWESWYTRTHSGQLLRQAGTAACILNEMLFGMSDQALDVFRKLFHDSGTVVEEKQKSYCSAFGQSCQAQFHDADGSRWKMTGAACTRQHVIDCVGTILHEYMAPEVWDLPIIHEPSLQSGGKSETIANQFLHDVATLHQVLIEGIGIFNLTLGGHFVSSGFLCSSLYLLLENLICSNSEVRHACDVVLRLVSATSGCSSVGDLVITNADYVIDSLCHQLRHLDLNPHVPNVISAMLSYVGVAHKILPLLEEPMHSVSMELEILGRYQHPELTIHFLKAVAEIAKAAKQEACLLPDQAESFFADVNSKVSDLKCKLGQDIISEGEPEPDKSGVSHDLAVNMENWESILFQLNDNKRYRRIIASIAVSCLTAVTPLLASEKEPFCLIAMNVIEDGIVSLAKVEEAFKLENKTKEGIEEVASLCSFYNLTDVLDAAEGTDENRLLPVMNKIWPFLVACVRSRIPVPVRRCAEVITTVVKICGGNFFSRRFHNDGPHFWKLLSTSPFKRKPIQNDEKSPLLPYRSTSRTLEDPVSESSNLKTQAAVLHMIAELSRDKKSASALDAVLKKVSGLVVGIACSGVTGLFDASVDALFGLASIDPDLIWLLLADVYYSMKVNDVQRPNPVFPGLEEILPPPSSSKHYLYVHYGGQTYGFDVNISSVENAFRKLYPEVSSTQAQL